MQKNLDEQQQLVNALLARRIHVYGAVGAEGFAVITWLRSIGHSSIIAHDFLPDVEQLKAEWARVHEHHTLEDKILLEEILADSKITWKRGAAYNEMPATGEILFLTQSWFRYNQNDFLKSFFSSSLAVLPEYRDFVWTLTRLYFALFKGTLIAVTGSDGKTTTTRMIGSIMTQHARAIGVRCIETGNDRTHGQSIADVASCGARDFLVLEVSDRQLSFGFPLVPDVAVVTNVTRNKHMDDYGGFEQYTQVKGNLIRFQTKQHHAVLNADDPASVEELVGVGGGVRQWVSLVRDPEDGIYCDGENFIRVHKGRRAHIMRVQDLGVHGRHNWYNAAEALLAVEKAGVSLEIATQALHEFGGVAHRLQPIRHWRRITFVEDSSGGNPANIPVTIQTFSKQPLVLIVGGYRPKLTFDEVAAMIHALNAGSSVVALLLIGQVAQQLKEIVVTHCKTFKSVFIVGDLPGAFAWVAEHAAELTRAQEAIVCMTPGFESFDQYKDYRARAAHFIQLAEQLPS